MLKQRCAKIEKDQIPQYKEQIEEMAKFVSDLENKAVWLALPQIGILRRAFVIRFQDGKIAAMLNPVITDTWHEFYPGEERCLSEPNIKKVVIRANKITVKFMTLWWWKWTADLIGEDARVAQHEIDHLDGVLLVDK